MSKNKIGILLSLCMAFVLSISVAVGALLFVHAEDGKVDVSVNDPLRFLSVEMTEETVEEETTAKVGFIINNNRGENSFNATSVATDKVVYTQADGGKRNVSNVRYVWDDFLPKLIFSFAEDKAENGVVEYAVGDTITIMPGFTFKNWNGNDLGINVVEEVKVSYTENGWSGDFVDSKLSNIQISNRNPGGIDVDFGISGVAQNKIVMSAAHWSDDNVAAWERMKEYVVYSSANNQNAYDRFWLSEDGKFTVTKSDDSLHPQAGDMLILKKGFAMWAYTAQPFMSFGIAAGNYVPLFVLHRNLQFSYDGTAWTAAIPATSAELNNEESLKSLCVNQVLSMEWTLSSGSTEVPQYTTSNPAVATVSESGVVTAVAEGDVTITAEFMNFEKSYDITIGKEVTATSLEFEIGGAAVRGGKQYLPAYVGEELDKEAVASRLTATPVYANGLKGISFAVTADMLDLNNFENDKEGETSISASKDGVSGDVPVYVYNVQTVANIDPSMLIGWAAALDVKFDGVVSGTADEVTNVQTVDLRQHPEYGIESSMVTITEPSWVAEPKSHLMHSIGQISQYKCLLFFENYDATNKTGLSIGSVLTFHEDFRFYQKIDESWIAVYKFEGPVSYVWDGTQWQNFVAEANDIVLSTDTVELPVGARFVPEITVLPEGAYAVPELSSDKPDIAAIEGGEIIAKAAGEATVSVKLGDVVKTIKVTVVESQAEGLELANNRTFYVSQGESFDISKVRVRVNYGSGYLGEEIPLSSDTATFELDTSIAGNQTVQVACSVKDPDTGVEVEDAISITVDVQTVIEAYPDNLLCHDDGETWPGTLILIFFQNTFSNQANVHPDALPEEWAKTITDHVFYYREGAEVVCDGIAYLTNMLTFTPRINGVAIETYEVGDTILLQKGLCLYRWFGEKDSSNNVPVGEGDYVKVGELKYDIRIVYNDQHKFAWQIMPEDGRVIEETVTVGLGEQHASNVEIIPSYASEGEWFYTVEDPAIASVSTTGMIKGLKQGETKVTAVLKKTDGTEVATVEYTIKVEDTVEKLEITAETPVVIAPGSEMNIAEWIEEFGITGIVVYTSGEKGDTVDLSNARVTGYDESKEGEQTLTFRLTVDGKSVTGTLTITVGTAASDNTGGCNSIAAGGCLAVAGIILVLGAILCLRKKESLNSK